MQLRGSGSVGESGIVCSSDRLDLALLAVLWEKKSSAQEHPDALNLNLPATCSSIHPSIHSSIHSHRKTKTKTDLPLGKPEIHLSSLLGDKSLVLLEGAADHTCGDGEVAIVTVEKALGSAIHPWSCRLPIPPHQPSLPIPP